MCQLGENSDGNNEKSRDDVLNRNKRMVFVAILYCPVSGTYGFEKRLESGQGE